MELDERKTPLNEKTPAPQCANTLKDGSRCRSVAVDGDYCAGCARKLAASETEALPRTTQPASEMSGRNVRERLRSDAELAYEQLIEALRDAITAETTRWGTCTNCKHRVAVTFPDVHARTKALELWLNQGYGKPSETKNVNVRADSILKEFSDMSDEELAAILAAAETEEAAA